MELKVQPPTVPAGDPNRHVWCQAALNNALEALAEAAQAAGWKRHEVAAALVHSADIYMITSLAHEEARELLEGMMRRASGR